MFIHDGARPFITDEILQRAYETAEDCGAAIVGVPVKDTIKIVEKDGTVVNTPDRTTLWAVQTPQVFLFEKIKAAYDEMIQLENQAKLQRAWEAMERMRASAVANGVADMPMEEIDEEIRDARRCKHSKI